MIQMIHYQAERSHLHLQPYRGLLVGGVMYCTVQLAGYVWTVLLCLSLQCCTGDPAVQLDVYVWTVLYFCDCTSSDVLETLQSSWTVLLCLYFQCCNWRPCSQACQICLDCTSLPVPVVLQWRPWSQACCICLDCTSVSVPVVLYWRPCSPACLICLDCTSVHACTCNAVLETLQSSLLDMSYLERTTFISLCNTTVHTSCQHYKIFVQCITSFVLRYTCTVFMD